MVCWWQRGTPPDTATTTNRMFARYLATLQNHNALLFCLQAGIAVDDWVKEIGGGMNFKRKRFLQLMDDVQQGSVGKLLIAHKDRLCRFGFEYFERMAKESGCELIVINQESLSPQQEMIEDLLAIVHTFSCRLYGLRRYKKILKDNLTAKNKEK